MVRMQIQLTEAQRAQVKLLAGERHISISEVVRQGVDHYLAKHPPVSREDQVRRALSVVGRFRSGRSDVSEKHDAHLAEAFKA